MSRFCRALSTSAWSRLPRKQKKMLVRHVSSLEDKKEVEEGALLLPLDVADALANGENPIRVLRRFRSFSQIELAGMIGITQGYLSDLESGKRKGTLELHQKTARALGVPLDLLAPVIYSEKEANPAKFAKNQKYIADMRRQRGFR